MPSVVDYAHRAAYQVGFVAARMMWRLLRPTHKGALVALHVGPDLLLVRQSYRRSLTLPGGGLTGSERAIDAARRELREELGLLIAEPDLVHVLTRTGIWDGRRDTVAFFALHLDRRPTLRLDNREIVDALFTTPLDARRLRLTGPAACYLDFTASTRSDCALAAQGSAPRRPP